MPVPTTSSKPSKHVCPDCGRAYKAAETLNRHRKNHSETSQYACSICDAAFKRKDLLDRHVQIHSGGKPTASRNRSHRACDRCSRLKTRCDNLTPCTRCSKGSHECSYKQTRSRARTDRSSASTTSSIHSSPHMTAEEISSIVGTPEEINTFDSNRAWTGNDAMVDSLWLQDPAWEWPPMIQNAPIMSPEPSSLRSTLLKDNIEPNFILDPALNLGSQPPTSSPMQASNLYDEVSYESSHMSWFSTRPDNHFESIPVSNHPTNPSSSKSQSADHHRRAPRSHSTPTPIPTCTLLGEAARIAQDATIKELVTLCTSTTTSENQSKYFWHSMSSKLELAFNMSGLVPCRDSNVFEHFISLFGKFFHIGFPIPSNKIPPYLTLVMAAIGAAYAGPKAETFHTRAMEALRVALVDVAATSDEGTFWLVQSLTLLLVAMLYFGDRRGLEVVPGLVGLVVGMARKMQLFGESGDVQRRRVAFGVVRLDAVVACLFGGEMLLGEEERRGHVSLNGKKDEDVLDRLLKKAGGSGPPNVPTKNLQWEAMWMGSSP